MLFNSFTFAAFFIAIYTLYLLTPMRLRVPVLLLSSLYFYGFYNWGHLWILMACILGGFSFGLLLERLASQRLRKISLWGAIAFNLALLGFFKYRGFLSDNLRAAAEAAGHPLALEWTPVAVPLGISFFVFQGLSYVIDIYDRKIMASRDLLQFATFKSFFPQLIAGPIERADHLLPQLETPKPPSWAGLSRGSPMILWGLFLKVVVADNISDFVNGVFATAPNISGLQLLTAVYGFTLQIYADFCGYSVMAIGLACVLGFDLKPNFAAPYLSRSPREFWRRWHITLSSWLREYVYIRLGGNQVQAWRRPLNLMITMLLGGLWHGASWTFVLWGGYHGALLAGDSVLKNRFPNFRPQSRLAAMMWAGFMTIFTFHLIAFGWLIFRCHDWPQLKSVFAALIDWAPESNIDSIKKTATRIAVYGGLVLAGEIEQRRSGHIFPFAAWWYPLRVLVYAALVILIIIFGVTEAQNFIYFQF